MTPGLFTRRSLALGVAAVLLMAAAPVTTTAASTTGGDGTVSVSAVPLIVETLGGTTSLGATTLGATNVGDPLSSVDLTLIDVDGVTAGTVGARSDGTTSEGAHAQTDTPTSAAASVASLTATADAAARTAAAGLENLVLTRTLVGGLGITLRAPQIATVVSPAQASAIVEVRLDDLSITLGSLLGDNLANLPLGDLLALADRLGITLPDTTVLTDLTDAVAPAGAAVQAIVDAIASATVTEDALALLEATDPTAGLPDAAAVASALSDLNDALSDVDFISVLILEFFAGETYDALGCPLRDSGSLTEETATAAVACLEGLQQDRLDAIADHEAELVRLQRLVKRQLNGVFTLGRSLVKIVDGVELPDLTGLDLELDTLLETLAGSEIIGVSGLGATQQVVTTGGDLGASVATISCDEALVSVIGLAPVTVVDCDAAAATLTEALEAAIATIGDVLAEVGGITVDDVVSVELFGTVENALAMADDGTVTGSSVLEILRLRIPEVTFDACDVVGIVCALGSDPLAAIRTLPDDLTDAIAGAVDLLGFLAVPTAPIDALTDLLAAAEAVLAPIVGTLGTVDGALLPGTTVIVDPALSASHSPEVTAAPDEVTDPDTTVDPPAAPTPAEEEPVVLGVQLGDDEGGPVAAPAQPALANTGGGAALLALAAIGGAAALRRRRD